MLRRRSNMGCQATSVPAAAAVSAAGLDGVSLWSFEQFAFVEDRSGTKEGDQVRGVDGPRASLRSVDQLAGRHGNSRSAGSRPFVTLVRNRTVASVDSIVLVVRRWIQCSAGYL